jgi:oligopeptide transport system substrate-binding protein
LRYDARVRRDDAVRREEVLAMRPRLIAATLLVVLVLGSLLPASAPTAAIQDAVGPKILRIAWGYFPETLDPQQTDIGQYQVTGLAFEGLTRQDEELAIVPAAAESWEFSADGMTLTFRLRDGLVYSDGSPLTAERFRYAIERQCDPYNEFLDVSSLFVIVGCETFNTSLDTEGGTPAAGEGGYEAARANLGARALDDRTLEIRFTRPAPYFPAVAAGSAFRPVKQELVEAGGPNWWLDPANWVSNGPFYVTTIQPGEPNGRIRLARNDHYWGGQAKLDGIEYRIIDDSLEAYRRGEIDVLGLSSDMMPEIEADPVLSRELLTLQTSFIGVFLMNLTREPFTDKKVREAFAYAFDRAAYCREVELGTCAATLSWIPPGVPGHIETDAYAFDPEKARQALAESSYGGPEDLPTVIWDVQDDPWDQAQAQWLADQFFQVLGVEMALEPITDEESSAKLWVDSATWPQFGSFFWYSDTPDPHDWLGFWTCGSEFFAVYIGYCNPDFDDLVKRADSELDPATRIQLAEEAGRLLVADAPSIFVYNPTDVKLVKPYVIGYSRFAPNQQWPGWWNPLALDLAAH